MEKAYNFQKHAEKDLKDAKNDADFQMAAEGAYRACVESIYTLMRKCSIRLPTNPEEKRERLLILDKTYPKAEILSKYYVINEHLHIDCFYHSECGNVRKWISKAREFLDSMSKLI